MKKLKALGLMTLALIMLAAGAFTYLYFIVAPHNPPVVTGLETFFEPEGHCPDSPMARLARIRMMFSVVPLGLTSLEVLRLGEELCRQKALINGLNNQRQLFCRPDEPQFECFKKTWAGVQTKTPFSLSGILLMLHEGVKIVVSSNIDPLEKKFQMAELSVALMEFAHAVAIDLTQSRYAAAKSNNPSLYKEAALIDYVNRTVRLKTLYKTHAELEGIIKDLEKAAQGPQQSRLVELKDRSRKIAENYDSFSLSYDAVEQKLKFELKQTVPGIKD